MLSENLLTQPWFRWGIAVVLGFPLITLVLTEVIQRLERTRPRLARTFWLIRVAMLPLLAVFVFFRLVLEVSGESTGLRLLITAVLVLTLAIVLSLVNAVVFGAAPASSWRGQAPQLLVDIVRVGLIVIGAALATASIWGVDLGGVVAALGVGGIIIGLAVQDTLASLFGGVALLMDKPFGVGDWIEVDGVEGVVTDINWRTVRLQTRHEDLVVIPNIVFGSQRVLNNSRPHLNHAEILHVGFSYDDPPNKVRDVLLDVAANSPGVLDSPAPRVNTIEYGDSSVDYEVWIYMANFDTMPTVRSEYMTRVWYAARRHQLTIPFPMRTVMHHDARSEQIEENEIDLAQRERSLSEVDGISNLLVPLAADASITEFARGEVLVREGAPADDMLLIIDGEAEGSLIDPTGSKARVARLGPNDFVGVSALLKGQRHIMTVVALTDVRAVILDPVSVGELTDHSAAFAHKLQSLFVTRKSAVDRALHLASLQDQSS